MISEDSSSNNSASTGRRLVGHEVWPSPVFVKVLGDIFVNGPRAGQSAAGLAERRHVLALLALSAASREGVPRAEVCGLLWPQLDDSQALNRLYNCMHALRRALGRVAWVDDWIRIEGHRVVLDLRVDSDARRLEAAARAEFKAQSDEQLWWLANNCGDTWAPAIEASDFARRIRQQLHEHYLALLRALAERYERQGTDSRLRRKALQRLLRENPIDEWALAQLLELDAKALRHCAVETAYERAKRDLAVRAGLRPTQRLSLLASQAASILAAGRHLALSATTVSLIGRDALLDTLTRQMTEGPGVWNLRGLPGVGKSALVRRLACRLAHALPDGAVVLGATEVRQHGCVAAAAVAALGLEAQRDDDGAAQRLDRHLRGRQCLIVLDEADDAWMGLLPEWPGRDALRSRVVLVSRLRVQGAWTDVPVAPLDLANASCDLLQSLLWLPEDAARSSWPPSEAQGGGADACDPEIQRLAALVDGIPKALEVCARYARTLSPAELSELLRRAVHDPASILTGSSLPEVLAYDLAPVLGSAGVAAQELLECAAAFDGEFSVIDVGAICRAAAGDEVVLTDDATARYLDELAEIGAVARRPHGPDEPPRYRLLHLVRIHAVRLAFERGRWPAILRAWLTWLVSQVHGTSPGYESPSHDEWRTRIKRLHSLLLRGVAAARRLDEGSFVLIAEVLAEIWCDDHAPADALPWLDEAIEVARRLGHGRSMFALLLARASLLLDARRPEEALRSCEEAMVLGDAVADRVDRARALTVQVEALIRCGQIAHALLLLYPELHRREPGEPGYLTIQAACWRHLRLAAEGAVVANRSMDPSDLNVLRRQLEGSSCWLDLLEALVVSHPALPGATRIDLAAELSRLARHGGSRPRLERGLRSQALAALGADDAVAARTCLIEAWRLGRAEGRPWQAFMSCLSLAEIDWRGGQTQLALGWLDEASVFAPAGSDFSAQVYLSASRCAAWSLGGRADLAYYALMRVQAAELRFIEPMQMWLVTEAAALLARALGLVASTRSLADQVRWLPCDTANTPLTQRFRAAELPAPMGAPGDERQSVPPALRLAAARTEIARFFGELAHAQVRRVLGV